MEKQVSHYLSSDAALAKEPGLNATIHAAIDLAEKRGL
jgi:hypothetical protein